MIEISKIRIDGGTQPRAEIDQATVAEYAEAYKSCANLPPITLFYDGAEYWLADGFHRYHGARLAGLKAVYEEITPGTRRDAILFSLSANSKHGLKRSNADKRKAVKTLLDDAEWSAWSSSAISKMCAVSHTFVDDVRRSYLATLQDRKPETVTVQRNGTTYEQNVSRIGKPGSDGTSVPAPAPAEEPPPEYTPLDEAHDTIAELQTQLALAHSVHLSDGAKTQAEELIDGLRKEISLLQRKLEAVTASRDQYQTENGELKKQILRQRREIDKITGSRSA